MRTVAISASIGLACAAALALPAMAANPQACAFVSPHETYELPTDLGDGLATQLITPGSYSAVSHATGARLVVDCRSGAAVAVLYFIYDGALPQDEWVDAGPAGEAFEAAFASRGFTRVDDVAMAAISAGLRAERFTFDEEPCACAAFYPELRGAKTPWSDQ